MLAALAMALALAAEPAADRSYRATLPNGLGVIVCHDARAPYVAVRVRYNAGSVDDPQGRSGLAHVVEHMTYEGSTHVPRALRELVELELAAHTNNAETGFHATDYHWTAPPEALEHLLWIEADRMAFVRGQHGAATLAGVQRIVANERRERVEQDPFMGLQLQAIAELFPQGDPYHGAVIGAAEEVAAATIADVDAFLGRHYKPDNDQGPRKPRESRRNLSQPPEILGHFRAGDSPPGTSGSSVPAWLLERIWYGPAGCHVPALHELTAGAGSRLLPSWPMRRILELAPAFWKQTIQQEDTQQRLAANVFRAVTLASHPPAA